MLQKLESGLLNELKKYGLEDSVLTKVTTLLTERRETAFDRATEQWITSELTTGATLSPQEVSEQLMRMVNGQAQLERLHQPLTEAFATRGFDKEQTETIFKRLARRIASGEMVKLPPGALAPNNMNFLLDRELRCCLRYHTIFSTIAITAEGLHYNNKARRLPEDNVSPVITRIYSIIKQVTRDIDLVGNIGGAFDKAVFIILTMTDETGALTAVERIYQRLGTYSLPMKTGTATVITALSVAVPPTGDSRYDLKMYLEQCLRNHRLAISACEKKYQF